MWIEPVQILVERQNSHANQLISNWALVSFYKCTVLRAELDEISTEVSCGKPNRMNSYALLNPGEAGYKMIKQDYKRMLSKEKSTDIQLELGNLVEFLDWKSNRVLAVVQFWERSFNLSRLTGLSEFSRLAASNLGY